MELTVDGVVVYKQINKSPQKMTNFWMRTLDNPKADVCLRNVYIGSEEINWTIWGQWSDCSHDCGGGTRTRTELCQQQSPHSRLRFIGQYQSKSKTTFNWKTGLFSTPAIKYRVVSKVFLSKIQVFKFLTLEFVCRFFEMFYNWNSPIFPKPRHSIYNSDKLSLLIFVNYFRYLQRACSGASR